MTPVPGRTPVPELSDRCYQELTLGESFGPFRERLEPGHCDRLRGPVGAPRPGSGAPLGVLPLVTLRVLRRALHGIIPGGVLVAQRFAVHAAIPAGAELEVEVAVTGQDRRGERLDTTFTFVCRHGDVPAATVSWTIMAPPP
jgi:hypothetical protein